MGLIMLVLIGLLPATYALNLKDASGARDTQAAAKRLKVVLTSHHPTTSSETLRDIDALIEALDGKDSLREVPRRGSLADPFHDLPAQSPAREARSPRKLSPFARSWKDRNRSCRDAIEYVPTWVIIGVALCLGIGTMIGYKRIVITVAEKIGKTHLTYAQGACAELVAMATIGLADLGGLPVSTTHVLSSGVAGTMWANRSGIQMMTLRNIGLAWVLTLPAASLLSAALFLFGHAVLGA